MTGAATASDSKTAASNGQKVFKKGRPTSPLAIPAATKVERRTVRWERVASARMAHAFPV